MFIPAIKGRLKLRNDAGYWGKRLGDEELFVLVEGKAYRLNPSLSVPAIPLEMIVQVDSDSGGQQ